MTDFAELAAHLDRTDTVTIVTTRSSGERIATPVWSVAVDGVPYVRSGYASTPIWHLRALSGRPVGFTLTDGRRAERDPVAALDDPRVEVAVHRVEAGAPEQDAVDEAYRRKYGHTGYLGMMTGPDARARTLRIAPLD